MHLNVSEQAIYKEKPQLRDLAEHTEKLAEWVSQKVGEPNQYSLASLKPMSPDANGFAGETFVVTLTTPKSDTVRCILKRKPTKHLYFLEHDFDGEVRTQRALGTRVPVARVIAYEQSSSILGSAFYLMEYVEGVPTKDHPSYYRESWLSELPAEGQYRICASGLQALALLHSVEIDEIGAGFLRRATTDVGQHIYNLDVWRRFSDAAWCGEGPSFVVEGERWLRENAPVPARIAVSWGDARPGNILFRNQECVALIDWDMVGAAAPEQDLGYWLAMDYQFQLVAEQMGGSCLTGWPDRRAMVKIYEAAARRTIDRDALAYYRVFAAYKIANMFARFLSMQAELDATKRAAMTTEASPPIAVLRKEMDAARNARFN